MTANDRQIGGDHYKHGGGEEHWDRAWRLKYDPFQYIITKWVERWRQKDGLQDLYKAKHAIEKYIELVEQAEKRQEAAKAGDPRPLTGYGPIQGQTRVGEQVAGKSSENPYANVSPPCPERFCTLESGHTDRFHLGEDGGMWDAQGFVGFKNR